MSDKRYFIILWYIQLNETFQDGSDVSDVFVDEDVLWVFCADYKLFPVGDLVKGWPVRDTWINENPIMDMWSYAQ